LTAEIDRKGVIMKKNSKLGMLIFVLAFVCAVILTACDAESEYTLINNSSYIVSGKVGSNSYSVGSGRTTHVMGKTLADTITYSPANLVNMTLSGGGFTATFTDK
jgi:hypothetical protein